MSERETYQPGVLCWVDTAQPDDSDAQFSRIRREQYFLSVS